MTKTLIILLIVISLLIVGAWWKWPTLKTIWLITKVVPYTQTIPDAPKVLVLGDSTAYGTGASQSSESIAGLLGVDFKVTIENNSVNGRTIGELREVVSNVAGDYELILLQIGANDILQERPLVEVEGELREIIEILSLSTRNLVMISSGNVGASPQFTGEKARRFETLSREFRDVFVVVANDTELTYIDLFDERGDDPFAQEPGVYVAIDGLHPTSAGYALWYKKLYPTLAAALEQYKK